MTASMVPFNGIDASTGGYFSEPMSLADVARLARGQPRRSRLLERLRAKLFAEREPAAGVRDGYDATNVGSAGWGVIFAYAESSLLEQRRKQLAPLLDLRRSQAGTRCREFMHAGAVRDGERADEFLARHNVGPGPADPERVPYYLLIVASPEAIPFDFQHHLDVDYAVGRIHFDDIESYGRYARAVVAAESVARPEKQKLYFFATANDDDEATRLSATELVDPLARIGARGIAGWSVGNAIGEAATKQTLRRFIGDAAFLFTATHGVAFPKGHPAQRTDQGGLLCQEWPGPAAWKGKPIPRDFYLGGHDVADLDVSGLVAFHFGCFSAGTPEFDQFTHGDSSRPLAESPFIASLPTAMLEHHDGPALAVVGHVDRAWTYSFHWLGAKPQTACFEDAIARLMAGHPIGYAMELFGSKYASIAVALSTELNNAANGKRVDELTLAGLWTSNNDARAYAILGDPAVRTSRGTSNGVS